jgi:transcriptional regulator NrdR family protein
MKCRCCNSSNTRVTATEHHLYETWRYCRCLDCDTRYKTIETYAVKKPGAVFGVKRRPNTIKRGEEHSQSVLTEANVKRIRLLAESGSPYINIAKEYGVHISTIYRIVKRKLWASVA